MMKRIFNPILIVLPLVFTTQLQARPLDAVGSCPMGASMRLANGAFLGNAQAMKGVAEFMQRHSVATQQEEPWLRDFAGQSGKNRLFQSGKRQVVISTLCMPTDCEHNRAYIAYEPATGDYGIGIFEGRQVRDVLLKPEKIVHSDIIGSAIICSQNLDWQAKKK